MNRTGLALAGATIASFFLMGPLPLKAQSKGVSSPQVSADGKVTFRLQAPNAKSVQVAGDFSGETFPLTKDDKGVWIYTTPALKPSSYQYWFIMDGLTLPDPMNTYVRPASGVYKSQFEVPGEETQWMAVRDVPHGSLHEHWYVNKENGSARRVVVYAPPGYGDAAGRSYPVLYLLHGANDYERGWTQAGRANWIMDNLIADGKAVPAIIVMPFGHETSGASGKKAENLAIQAAFGVTGEKAAPSPGGVGNPGSVAYMEKDLLNNVLPLVEKEYRVLKDANHRAIAGYSMGGIQATTIGFTHPELFAYVGGLSGYAKPDAIKKYLADVPKANKDFKVLWIGCGSDDTMAIGNGRIIDKMLTEMGVHHRWTETPGYRHDYQIWRIYLRDMTQLLFKDAN